MDVSAGDTLLIPAGWAAAAATTVPTLAVGGHYLRGDALAVHLEAWRVEVRWPELAWGVLCRLRCARLC